MVPLDPVREALTRYVAFPDEHTLTATVLWVAHTWATEAFYTTPRLSVQSPEKESGKTRLLEVLALLCREARLWTHISPAVLYRRIGTGPVTVLLDEVDNVFVSKNDPDKADLRSVLNEGYRYGAQVPRCVGANRDEIKEFPVYAPVALAGIGTIPDTLLSRSIIVPMRRRVSGEQVQPFREREAREQTEPLRADLAAWTARVADDLRAARPTLPDGVTDRAADCWEPLLAIADVAGGDWPKQAEAACAELVKSTRDATISLGVRLLTDCKTVFDEPDAMHTEDLLAALHNLDNAPWGDLRGEPLTARGLARLLGPYGVRSQQVKIAGLNRRGYVTTGKDSFADAWARYCTPADISIPGTSATSATSATRDTNAQVSAPGSGRASGSGPVVGVADDPLPDAATPTEDTPSDLGGSGGSGGSASVEGDMPAGVATAADREAELMARDRVCEVCGSTEALLFLSPHWKIRCRPHDPGRQSAVAS